MKLKFNKDLTKQLEHFAKNWIDVIGFADINHFNNFYNDNHPSYYQDDALIIIIIGLHLFDQNLDIWTESKDLHKNYHFLDNVLEKYCYKIKNFLSKKGFESEIIPYTPGIFLKDSAALAGIGPIGKNNLLITKNYGSQVRLRAMTTNAPLNPGIPIKMSKFCLNCDLCIKACPAGAFHDGKYIRELCLSYNLTNLKELSEYSSIWCNICIESCPIGKNTILKQD